MVRSLTVIFGCSSVMAVAARGSDADDIADGRDEGGCHDDADDPRDDRRSGGLAHRRGAPPGLDAAQAAGQRHEDPEHTAHEETDEQVVQVNGALRFEKVLRDVDVEHRDAYDEPAQYPHEVGVEAEER